jgi:DMSO/TMAO reductase YedYZ molybdopterin-dependent catalytic subunit
MVFTAISMTIQDFLGFNGTTPLPSLIWLFAIYISWGLILARLVAERAILQVETIIPAASEASASSEGSPAPTKPGLPAKPGMSRRQFLLLVVAGVSTAVISALRINSERTASQGSQPTNLPPSGLVADSADTSGPAQSPSETVLEARFPLVPGTRLELTPPDDFYRVDINLEPPYINLSTWRLVVDGLVDKPLSLSLDDLRSRPSYSQAITLECISNPVGGDLISTGVWTGVRLKDILQEAGMKPNVKEVYMEAADGYYESATLDETQDDRTLLIYGMDGGSLSAVHGYPLRLYVPNRHGMKLPKWITHLKAVDYEAPGYWVDRGWSSTAIVNTTSVIDIVAVKDRDPNTGLVPVGGIAYAGERGISKVEIKVDDNPWQAAELRDPPLSPLTWVQWRYFWQPTPGSHTLMVRATDGMGELQRYADMAPFPNGATGYYRISVKI